MNLRFELHERVRCNAAVRGAEGAAWLARLPRLVAELESAWGIKVGRIFPNATEAYVSEASKANGEQVVLKVPLAGSEKSARELGMLQAANGRGYVRLLRYDPESGAMLLERLGPQLAQMNNPVDKQIEIICATLQSAWMPLPHGMYAMTGGKKADEMAAYIQLVWPKLGEPCSRRAVAVALRFAAARRNAFDPASAVLGHGDAHGWNTLYDPKAGNFKFVDPDGLFIERAHDLSISMREWSADLLAGDPVILGRQRCELLANLTGVDPVPIWQWGFIERLVNGLLYLERGPAENAAEFLDVVEAWALTEPS